MTAFYNEIDPYAAQWLRNLIAAGHIAPGVVDERSIEDILPHELLPYTQCHFFAGIGVWSLALRRAGWADDRPIWTGSCPCQPFSAAGEGVGFADERHLWPAFYHLISQCRPPVVAGEQVASGPAAAWLDLVCADMEGLDFAFGALAFPSAGVGAPHIRDRTYWTGIRMDDANDARLAGHGVRTTHRCIDGVRTASGPIGAPGAYGWLGHTDGEHPGRHSRTGDSAQGGAGLWAGGDVPAASGSVVGLADDSGERWERGQGVSEGREHDGPNARRLEGDDESFAVCEAGDGPRPAGPTNGLWRDADWLFCRDGKWRPVEPGTFPLAHGAASRVGRLRAYGNAINAEAARAFIEATGLV